MKTVLRRETEKRVMHPEAYLVIISVPVAIGLYLLIKPKLVQRRRTRLRRRPLPQGVEEVLARNVGLYSRLPDLYEQLKKFYAVHPASWK
jgi:hypothetical protein